jgi:hypothetical protein
MQKSAHGNPQTAIHQKRETKTLLSRPHFLVLPGSSLFKKARRQLRLSWDVSACGGQVSI